MADKQYENPIRKPQGSEELTPYSKKDIEAKIKRQFLPRENPFKAKQDKEPPMKRAQSPDKLPKQQYT